MEPTLLSSQTGVLMKPRCNSFTACSCCIAAVSCKDKKRTSLSLILESGEPREVHHFATLLGFGASAINPYLAQDTVKQLVDEHMLDKDYYAAIDDYNHAIITGIVKIAAKMGISTIQSYQGSKILRQSVLTRVLLISISQIQ